MKIFRAFFGRRSKVSSSCVIDHAVSNFATTVYFGSNQSHGNNRPTFTMPKDELASITMNELNS
eukprot:scaffold39100_cov129-Skeletonema_marinoi.AAC.3